MNEEEWRRADAVARRVLETHRGAARLREFLLAGLTANQVAAMRRREVLHRPRSGWYVDPELPWRAKHAVRVGGILCCASACDSFGLPVPPRTNREVHVLLQHNAPRVRHHRDSRHLVVPGEDTEVVRHWSDVDGARVGWRTTLLESLVALANCVPLDWFVAALDAALHRPRDREPLLTEHEVQELRRRLPERLRFALLLTDLLAESPLETLLRLAMRRRGIGPVVAQFVPHPAYRADFLVGRRLLVEADGEAFHDEEADRIRDRHLASLGYVVLRFGYAEIVNDIERVLDRIEAALRALA